MLQRSQKIQKVGNSAAVILPKEWLDQQRLKPGSRIRLILSEGQVILMSDEPDREIPGGAKFRKELTKILKQDKAILKRLS